MVITVGQTFLELNYVLKDRLISLDLDVMC